MELINFRSFSQKVRYHKKAFKRFLNKLDKKPPKDLFKNISTIEKEVWKEINCLSCANCCKKMTPTFTNTDIKRISSYLKMTEKDFKAKWLFYDKEDKDWQNTTQPCQFLDLSTNMCNIYDVRPADCSGFPHFTKRKPELYLHVHQQNIEYCPATYKMVEKLMLVTSN